MLEFFGFEMLEILKEIDFNLVFIIVYDDYVVKVFKVSVVDYLFKFVDKNELVVVIEKVKFKERLVL